MSIDLTVRDGEDISLTVQGGAARRTEENIEDIVAALLSAGESVTLTYDDANDDLEVAVPEAGLSFYDGTNLTADVDNSSTTTEQADITNETLVYAESDSDVAGISSGQYASPSFGTVTKDERDEFASDAFTPDKTGFYVIAAAAADENNGADNDRLQCRFRNTTDNTSVGPRPQYSRGTQDFLSFPWFVGVYPLAAGKAYQYQVRNRDSSFTINDSAFISIRSVFR